MTNLLEKFNEQQKALLKKDIPEFRTGDTLKVSLRIIDGVNERIQIFEGVCIAINKGRNNLQSSFVLRKVSYGESIELQVFFYSTILKSVEVLKYGKLRRAKAYYLRNLFGKAARIKERKRK